MVIRTDRTAANYLRWNLGRIKHDGISECLCNLRHVFSLEHLVMIVMFSCFWLAMDQLRQDMSRLYIETQSIQSHGKFFLIQGRCFFSAASLEDWEEKCNAMGKYHAQLIQRDPTRLGTHTKKTLTPCRNPQHSLKLGSIYMILYDFICEFYVILSII